MYHFSFPPQFWQSEVIIPSMRGLVNFVSEGHPWILRMINCNNKVIHEFKTFENIIFFQDFMDGRGTFS